MNRWDLEEIADARLFKMLPEDQVQRVFTQERCDIEPGFLGFILTYEYLSYLIPKNWTVVDLGCAYNPQCFLFEQHRRYIAVDIGDIERFCAPNCEIWQMPIEQFCREHAPSLNLDETFAICNYVPNWGANNREIVGNTFKNMHVFYPCNFTEDNIVIVNPTGLS